MIKQKSLKQQWSTNKNDAFWTYIEKLESFYIVGIHQLVRIVDINISSAICNQATFLCSFVWTVVDFSGSKNNIQQCFHIIRTFSTMHTYTEQREFTK